MEKLQYIYGILDHHMKKNCPHLEKRIYSRDRKLKLVFTPTYPQGMLMSTRVTPLSYHGVITKSISSLSLSNVRQWSTLIWIDQVRTKLKCNDLYFSWTKTICTILPTVSYNNIGLGQLFQSSTLTILQRKHFYM